MTTEEKVAAFLKEFQALEDKYQIALAGNFDATISLADDFEAEHVKILGKMDWDEEKKEYFLVPE